MCCQLNDVPAESRLLPHVSGAVWAWHPGSGASRCKAGHQLSLQNGVDVTATPQAAGRRTLSGAREAPRSFPKPADCRPKASESSAVSTLSHPSPPPSQPTQPNTERPAASITRRFVPIGIKFALLSVLVVGVATAIAFFHATGRERERMLEAKRISASMLADLLAQSLQAPLDFADEDAARNELDHLEQNKEVVYAGAWLGDSATPMVEMRAAGPAFALPGDLRTPRTVASSECVEAVRTVFGRGKKPIGSTLIQFSLARENAELRVARRDILLYSLALALGTMGLLILVTRFQIVLPIQKLLDAARRVEKGEQGAAVQIHANDEIGRLAGAFNAMNDAIFDREQRLAAANKSLRELFDHMRQGIVVFGPDGKLDGMHSKAAAQIFGNSELEGADARDLLYGGVGHWDAERRAFEEWLPLGFEAPEEHWEELSALAPQRVSLHPGGSDERDVTLEFRPIMQHGSVSKIMLLATDETRQRSLEREIERQGTRHKSQIAVMRRIVSGGGQQFVAFLEHAQRRFERALGLLVESGERLSVASLGELFQITHSIRAEAQTFELGELVDALRGLEQRLAELRENCASAGVSGFFVQRSELDDAVGTAIALVEQSKQLFVEASPLGKAALGNVVVRKSDVTRLLELCSGKSDEIARCAARLAARPFGECVASLLELAPSWAEKENKRVRVEVDGRDFPVPPALAEVLTGVLVHLVRNAIAHGIEPAPERMTLGKPPIGLIELVCQQAEGDRPLVFVDDDGHGILQNALLASAARSKQPLRNLGHSSQSTLAQATDLAGHGVGLAAVETDLARVGYCLSVAERESGGTRFVIGPQPGSPA
jgi:two-component system, chemotaxis family, sensor kinase CheA